ncbi:MAG TPA: hypothetical protein DIW46_07380 [Microbacterium sp.]|nr:hypothetical protein [Microbacterium sp.]
MQGFSDFVIRVRNSAPPFVRNAIDRTIAAERGPIAWAKEKMLVREDVPAVASPRTDHEVRLLITPMNYAGQGREWARSLDAAEVEAVNLAVLTARTFHSTADTSVSAAVFAASREWRSKQREALPLFTHVMIESFTSPLGRGTGDVVRDDVAWLKTRNVRVALLCHGTDVRHPNEHIATHPFSPFLDLSASSLERAERSASTNARIAADSGVPVFVSTPDLLVDVPNARWLPVVVEPDRWASTRGVDAAVPVVMHMPSSGPIKGTAHADRAAEILVGEGIIEYRRLQDVPAERVPGHVGDADVVIDQLLLGSYGVAACEALAAGRVVVGNVDDAVREHVRSVTGLEVPIVQADPESLVDVLRGLAADPVQRKRIAARGPEFVSQIHSGVRTRAVLADYLDTAG